MTAMAIAQVQGWMAPAAVGGARVPSSLPAREGRRGEVGPLRSCCSASRLNSMPDIGSDTRGYGRRGASEGRG